MGRGRVGKIFQNLLETDFLRGVQGTRFRVLSKQRPSLVAINIYPFTLGLKHLTILTWRYLTCTDRSSQVQEERNPNFLRTFAYTDRKGEDLRTMATKAVYHLADS